MNRKSEFDRKKLLKIHLVATDVDGVLTDSGMFFSSRGEEFKRFSTRDGMGFELLRRAGIKTAIITSEYSSIVRSRATKLHVDFLFMGAGDKKKAMKALSRESGVDVSRIAYIGDDVNDLPAIELAGVSAAPADASPFVKEAVDMVLTAKGGYGAFRELVGIILEEQLRRG